MLSSFLINVTRKNVRESHYRKNQLKRQGQDRMKKMYKFMCIVAWD